MLTKFLYLSLACFALPLVSFNGVPVNHGGMDLQIQFDSIINGGAANLSFYNGIIRLSEIEFEGEKTNGEVIDYELAQATSIDLTTALASPALEPIIIPAGDYKVLALEVKGAENGSVLYLEGSFTDSDQKLVPLQINIQESVDLVIEYHKNTVNSAISLSANFLIDPSHWFSNISQQDLQQADRDSNGVVIISPYQNSILYKRLTKDLSKGIEWEWDE